MTRTGDTVPAAPKSATSGWQAARERIRQLEFATQRMSPRWFAGNMGVVTAASLSLLTAVVLGFSLLRIQDLSREADHHQEALLESMALQEALDDASITARAYVATQDERLLTQHEADKTTVNQSLSRLEGLVPGDAPARLRLSRVKSAALRRLQAFDILARTPHDRSVPARVSSSEAERSRTVRDSTAALADFRVEETAQLRDVQARVRENMQFCIGLVLIAGFAAPFSGAIGMRLLRQAQQDQRTRDLQTELMHVQRLAIMGETSAMLAHEINQPLAAANNYLSVLRRHLEAGAPDKATPMADRVQQQIHRAASILGKLRRFIEKRESERTLEAPEMLVDDAITLLGTIDGTVELRTDIGSRLPRVLVDRVQIQQVLVNLMRNAIEAMQASPRHELLLSVSATDNGAIQISLADTGPGLTQEVAERLFQPFVSTKSGGMGVGLSICRAIISSHGGRIWAEPNTAGGTTFNFVLPAAEERVAA